MAINVSFNGATIYKPGAYSRTEIDLGGAFPIGATGIVGIIGEADRGKPGSLEIIQNNGFTGSQAIALREKYGSGPIVDALNMLFAPAADAAIPNGAQFIYVYKTNASTAASLAVPTAFGTINALEYGVGGNRIAFTSTPTAETGVSISTSSFATASAGTMSVRVNGGTATDVIFAGSENAVATAALIDAVTGITAIESAGEVVISITADANAHQNGYSQTFELVNASFIGLTDGVVASGAVEASSYLKVDQKRDSIIEDDTIGGNVVMNVSYDGANTTASITVDDKDITLTAGASTVFQKSAYTTLSDLVAEMSLVADFTVTLESALYGQLNPAVLDQVTTLECKRDAASGSVARIKKDGWEVLEFFASSQFVSFDETSAGVWKGLPDVLAETVLAGGAKGATSNADVSAALTEFQKVRINAVVPLFSRDAATGGTTTTNDIADDLTDSSSTYTIEAVHQAVKTHLSLMKTTKRRLERQGYLSFKDTWENTKLRSQTIADARVQLCFQDSRNTNSFGNILWFQPWATACLLAGSRMGSTLSTPMTFKYMNCAGIRHTSQAMSTDEADIVIDFDPDLDYDDAIKNGVTSLEAPVSGGFRIVVDNTTYGRDANWVWNRGSVIYAADVVAHEWRDQMERIYVGKKNNVSNAEVTSTAAGILSSFVDDGTIIGTNSLSVTITGSTIKMSVKLVMVEGIEFILEDITLQRNQG